MMLRALPLITGISPMIAVNVCYLIAVRYVPIPACIPYFSGCASISMAGRYEPANILFRAVMLPEAALLAVYWVVTAAWLGKLLEKDGRSSVAPTWIAGMGIGCSIALILYTVHLGFDVPFYEFMRRFGVYFYFGLMVIAQLVLAIQLSKLPVVSSLMTNIIRVKYVLAVTPFVVGVIFLGIKATHDDVKVLERIIEWNMALAAHINIALTYYLWRETGFKARLFVD